MRQGYLLLTTILMTAVWLRTQQPVLPPLALSDVQVKRILQLGTEQVTFERTYNHSDHTYHLFNLIESSKVVSFTGLVTVRFGYDLTDIRWAYDQPTNSIRILRLPPKKVLDMYFEVQEFQEFRSGWLNAWSKEELTKVLGKDGIRQIKEQLSSDPQILELAFQGSSNAVSYIKDTLGLPFDGYQKMLDQDSIDKFETRMLQ